MSTLNFLPGRVRQGVRQLPVRGQDVPEVEDRQGEVGVPADGRLRLRREQETGREEHGM